MSDPRDAIPDTILTAPDNTQWLARSYLLAVSAARDGDIQISITAQILPVAQVVEGVAHTYPNQTAISEDFRYTLADVPAELAQELAVWLAQQASVNGTKMLNRLYPAEQPAP